MYGEYLTHFNYHFAKKFHFARIKSYSCWYGNQHLELYYNNIFRRWISPKILLFIIHLLTIHCNLSLFSLTQIFVAHINQKKKKISWAVTLRIFIIKPLLFITQQILPNYFISNILTTIHHNIDERYLTSFA